MLIYFLHNTIQALLRNRTNVQISCSVLLYAVVISNGWFSDLIPHD